MALERVEMEVISYYVILFSGNFQIKETINAENRLVVALG